jgi:hypothetical protein
MVAAGSSLGAQPEKKKIDPARSFLEASCTPAATI